MAAPDGLFRVCRDSIDIVALIGGLRFGRGAVCKFSAVGVKGNCIGGQGFVGVSVGLIRRDGFLLLRGRAPASGLIPPVRLRADRREVRAFQHQRQVLAFLAGERDFLLCVRPVVPFPAAHPEGHLVGYGPIHLQDRLAAACLCDVISAVVAEEVRQRALRCLRAEAQPLGKHARRIHRDADTRAGIRGYVIGHQWACDDDLLVIRIVRKVDIALRSAGEDTGCNRAADDVPADDGGAVYCEAAIHVYIHAAAA